VLQKVVITRIFKVEVFVLDLLSLVISFSEKYSPTCIHF